jgi:UDP-GlcNAc3NAcA epimerase
MPEEINRVLTDHAADLLLAPTAAAMGHLAREGLSERALRVGDVMYDATLHAAARARASSDVVERLGLADAPYAVATVHRAENTDDRARLARITAHLRDVARERTVVWPVHPRTAGRLSAADAAGLRLTEPLPYLDLQALLDRCELVLTDSGGLQKEAYFHRKPCVTLRSETEWTETIAAGWNRLWTDTGPTPPRTDIADYGDGHAAEACVDAIVRFLERAPRAASASASAPLVDTEAA